MIGNLNHIAIAVPDLKKACLTYKKMLGVALSEPMDVPSHGVTIVFVELTNSRLELIAPLGSDSPIKRFLEKNPVGGIHHVCFEVDDIFLARDHLISEGARVLGSNMPKKGVHGKPVLFLHPKDFQGALIELEQK